MCPQTEPIIGKVSQPFRCGRADDRLGEGLDETPGEVVHGVVVVAILRAGEKAATESLAAGQVEVCAKRRDELGEGQDSLLEDDPPDRCERVGGRREPDKVRSGQVVVGAAVVEVAASGERAGRHRRLEGRGLEAGERLVVADLRPENQPGHVADLRVEETQDVVEAGETLGTRARLAGLAAGEEAAAAGQHELEALRDAHVAVDPGRCPAAKKVSTQPTFE